MRKVSEKIFFSLLSQLINEKFAKKIVLSVFRWIVQKTKTTKDNEIYNSICEAWQMEQSELKEL